jgi:predicted dehydrogenase
MRFGLIGCGEIGELRAKALEAMASHSLVAVSDIDTVKARNLATRCGAHVVGDWKSLCEYELDAVIVSTPPSTHAEISTAALNSGKHVLCEKPLARTEHECREMIQAAEEAGRLLATGFNYRFYPSIRKSRELLESGVIGKLDHIRSFTGYSASDHNHEWLHDHSVMGGGTMWDNGIHLIDLTCYFLGDVVEIKGFTTSNVWNFEGCEDNGFALVRNKDGRVASIHTSWTEWRGYRLLLELYGTKGYIRAWCFPMITKVAWSDAPGYASRHKMHLFPRTHLMEKLRSYRWVVTQSFIEELQEFSHAVDGNITSLATGYDGLRALTIAQSAARSL